MSYVFTFGKYKNLSVDEIFEKDPNYLNWMYSRTSAEENPHLFNSLEAKLRDKNTIYINFGRYKGKSIHHVMKRDKSYIIWLRGNEYVRNNMRELYNMACTLDLD